MARTTDLHRVPPPTARRRDATTIKRVGSSARREVRGRSDGSPNPAHGLTEMANSRNLLRRLPKPAAGNGRVQRGVERALIAHNGGPITTSIAVEWAYALRRYQGEPIKSQHLVYVRRALDRVADRLRRVPPFGAWLWRARPLIRIPGRGVDD
jgi:hypothetical protein